MTDTISRAEWEMRQQARRAGYRDLQEYFAAHCRRRRIRRLEQQFADLA